MYKRTERWFWRQTQLILMSLYFIICSPKVWHVFGKFCTINSKQTCTWNASFSLLFSSYAFNPYAWKAFKSHSYGFYVRLDLEIRKYTEKKCIKNERPCKWHMPIFDLWRVQAWKMIWMLRAGRQLVYAYQNIQLVPVWNYHVYC